ncbi:hypothetical protein P6F26_19510, partial [Roseibacterium sp. SDUM158017]|nr:hypothetical protein [Roseibacterium sp. SDUM158017]
GFKPLEGAGLGHAPTLPSPLPRLKPGFSDRARDGIVATIGLICGGASVLLTAAILTSLAAGAEAMIH